MSDLPNKKTDSFVTQIQATSSLVISTASVTNTATLLPATALAGRTYIRIYNNSGFTIYYGPSTVTTGTGFPLLAGQLSPELYFSDAIVLYGIKTGAPGADVRIMEVK